MPSYRMISRIAVGKQCTLVGYCSLSYDAILANQINCQVTQSMKKSNGGHLLNTVLDLVYSKKQFAY